MILRMIFLPGLILLTATLGAQTGLDTQLDFELASELATEASSEIIRLERAVASALDDLGWGRYRDDLSLDLGGSVGGPGLDALQTTGSATLELELSVLPQLTVSGELTARYQDPEPPQTFEPLAGSVGVTFRPLADASGADRDELALARAEAELLAASREVAWTAISRVIDAVRARDELALGHAELGIAEDHLAATAALAARDRATDDDVESASDGVRRARQEVMRAELQAQRAQWDLARLLALDVSSLGEHGWEPLDLQARVTRVAALREELDRESAVGASSAVVGAMHAVRSAEIALHSTRRFTPEVSATASVDLPQATYSLGFGFSVSPADWDGDARATAGEDLAFAESALEAAIVTQGYALDAALLEFDLAVENLRATEHDLELARSELTEAEFRFNRGDITPLALERVRHDVRRAELAVRWAEADVVKSWYRVDLLQF